MNKSMYAGRNALVTGGSQGLGRTIALRLAELGGMVVVNCASSVDKAQKVADEINANCGHSLVYRCDISDENAVKQMFVDLEKKGGIDILVNNARTAPGARRPEMTESEWWDKVMNVNLKGAYLCSLEFCRYAEARGWGRIVNVSSCRAYRPAEASMVAYNVSKLGMHALTRSFAEREAVHGITVNTLVPGLIMTENVLKRLSREEYEAETRIIPLHRGGTCDEIADGVIWAINNSYMTGESININGGQHYAP